MPGRQSLHELHHYAGECGCVLFRINLQRACYHAIWCKYIQASSQPINNTMHSIPHPASQPGNHSLQLSEVKENIFETLLQLARDEHKSFANCQILSQVLCKLPEMGTSPLQIVRYCHNSQACCKLLDIITSPLQIVRYCHKPVANCQILSQVHCKLLDIVTSLLQISRGGQKSAENCHSWALVHYLVRNIFTRNIEQFARFFW